MANLQAYKNLFYRLLPSGDLWPTQDATSANWEKYVRAIVSELQRVDAEAESWLDDFFPDASADPGQLEDWERILGLPDPNCDNLDWTALTDAQRRSVILDTLAGNPVNVADFEAKVDEYTGGSSDLTGPILPVFYAGSGLAGQPGAGPAWAYTFMLEYMTHILTPTPDDWSGWTNTGAFAVYTANDRRAPDGTLTADHIDAGATGNLVRTSFSSTSDGDRLRFSVWLYVDAAVDQDMVVRFVSRAGTVTDTNITVPIDRWRRYEFVFDCESGGTTPRIEFVQDANEDAWFWGGYCGIINELVECVVSRAKPAHTYVSYRCTNDDQEYPLT